MKAKEIIALEERLAKYDGEDRIISSHELQTEIENMPQTAFSFPTKVPALDSILENVESGELIIVSGGTGAGKTTFLSTITKNIADEVPVAWFTLEVTQRQFLKKFGDKIPLFYTPAKNTENNVKWLIERIIEAKLKHDVKMVFIDHLHQIFSVDRFNGVNLSLELGDIVAKIKQIAIEYNIVIWLIAHGTDAKNSNREPKMTDVRDSGMIIRLADVVLGVWRIPNSFTGNEDYLEENMAPDDVKTKIRVWKNRRVGKMGSFVMIWDNGTLVDCPSELDKFGEDTKSKYQKKLYDGIDKAF